jgi:tRNA threonylcarbamoyl adenosine modification protein YjeE
MIIRTTHSEGETGEVGREMAASLRPGQVVLLEGLLGAGKTAFVRGLAEGLGADPAEVSSPTFTIVQEYRGGTPLQHIDLYRLSPLEVDDLGIDEMLETTIVAVEWPDRWRHPPEDAVRVTIAVDAGTDRRITIAGLGAPSPEADHSTR